jgi:hypothetical protein
MKEKWNFGIWSAPKRGNIGMNETETFSSRQITQSCNAISIKKMEGAHRVVGRMKMLKWNVPPKKEEATARAEADDDKRKWQEIGAKNGERTPGVHLIRLGNFYEYSWACSLHTTRCAPPEALHFIKLRNGFGNEGKSFEVALPRCVCVWLALPHR